MKNDTTQRIARTLGLVAPLIWSIDSMGNQEAVAPQRTGRVARVIDESLNVIEGDPLLIDELMVSVQDPVLESKSKFRPIQDVLAIIIGPSIARDLTVSDRMASTRAGDDIPISTSYIELVDGQRLPGSLHADDEGIPVWRSAWVRDIPFDLETLRSIRLQDGAVVPEAIESDIIVLSNGDRLSGLVLEIEAAVEMEVERSNGDLDVISVPLDRIASISLLNPLVPRSGTMVWLRGGHRISSDSIQIGEDGYVRLLGPAVGGETAEIPADFLIAVATDANRIDSIASMEITVQAGPGSGLRPWIPEPTVTEGHHPLGASPVRLDGPLEATIRLPRRGCQFMATVERPMESGPGRLVLRIFDGDRELQTIEVTPESPVHQIRALLSGDRLVLRIEDGGDGPFHDTIVLREAVVIRPGN